MKTAIAIPASSETTIAEKRSVAAMLADLVKARLTFLVLVTTLVGFYMGLGAGAVDYSQLAACMIGTMLCAAGAAALNQVWERESDARMKRTSGRPLPAGEMKPTAAMLLGLALCVLGLGLLWSMAHTMTALVALATIVSYVLIYTPLKKRTTLNTLVGAIPGALPPVIGYAASAQRLDLVAWLLFGILFFWQLPHFLAISWLYREDYQLGGFAMLSCRDQTGTTVASRALVFTGLLTVVSVLPYFLGINNLAYLIVALLLNGGFLYQGVVFARKRDRGTARKLFFYSIIYLPVLLGIMVFTRHTTW